MVVDNQLFVFGGFDNCAQAVQVYSPDTDSFIQLVDAKIPFGAGGPATAYMSGNVYLCGGVNHITGSAQKTCAAFNPHLNTWSDDVAPLPVPLSRAGFASNGFDLNVAGGRSGPDRVSTPEDKFYSYNLLSNSWRVVPSAQLPVGLAGITGAVRTHRSFIILGGEAPRDTFAAENSGLNELGTYARVDRFNIVTD